MPVFRTDDDHDAVLASDARHLVVTAPPGTGKTFLSVRLAGQLAGSLPEGARVLLLTFSTQARTQLEREAGRQLDASVRRLVEVSNYHRFFWQAVGAYRRALGLPLVLDIGSGRRRLQGLELAMGRELGSLGGIVEDLAEHEFPEFRNGNTPSNDFLARLLDSVHVEQQAGRLVFDDLGALFWTLLEQFPAIDQVYSSRYPIVIADEHQDASALQDAVVRRLASSRLVVFADPMQLIHEFRGASQTRLDRHLSECEQQLVLRTPHRWHGSNDVANWLLAVRARLQGTEAECTRPHQVRIEYTRADHGFNGMKSRIKIAIAREFQGGAKSIAVLARSNDSVSDLRSYLSQQGHFPRQVGSQDFEDARLDMEQLPQLQDLQAVAHLALGRLATLVPTVTPAVVGQTKSRLRLDGVNIRRAGEEAARILLALAPIYRLGPGAYFQCLAAALDACSEGGHHLPRAEAVRAIRACAASLSDEPIDLDEALQAYANAVVVASHIASPTRQGLFVMTAHQSKGKEFDAIILADAMQRFWPDDSESRRLFYVAITRASQSWTLIAPDRGETQLLAHI